jgi:hypothetical protein
MGEMRSAYSVLVERLEGKRSFGRLRHRWKDSNKMDLREIIQESKDFIHVAQDKEQ